MAHRAKRLKLAASAKKLEMDSRAEYKARRNDLGEVFGTRKAKSQIRAEERNRVDVGAMQGVKGHLMEAIPKTAMLEEGECSVYWLTTVFTYPHLVDAKPQRTTHLRRFC
jgi:DNA-directed RNA polymerase I subunit RPA49